MNGKRAKQIRRASGLIPKIYKEVRDLAIADGHPEEIYMAVPQQNSRVWDGRGSRLDVGNNMLSPTRKGKRKKYTPPDLRVLDTVVGLFPIPAVTQQFVIRHIPQLPRRLYLNTKRQYGKLVRTGRQAEALSSLSAMDPKA